MMILKVLKDEIAKDLQEKAKTFTNLPRSVVIKSAQGFKKLGRDWVLSRSSKNTLGTETGQTQKKSFRVKYTARKGTFTGSMSSYMANIWQNKKRGRKINFLSAMGRKFKSESIVEKVVRGLLERISKGVSIER
jgi:hypothetical protein